MKEIKAQNLRGDQYIWTNIYINDFIKQKDSCFIVYCMKSNTEHIFLTLLT